jgi:hypothetical protein
VWQKLICDSTDLKGKHKAYGFTSLRRIGGAEVTFHFLSSIYSCSPLKLVDFSEEYEGNSYAFITLVSCLVYSSTLKMGAKCTSERSVGFQWAKQRYIPEDGTLYNHSFENPKSYIPFIIYLDI